MGIAVGVAALILALSIVRGFSLEIDKKLTGFAAHVQVQSIKDEPLNEAQDTERLLRAQPFVKEVDAVLQEFILVRKTSRDIEGVAIWGTTRLPSFIQSSLIDGVGLEVHIPKVGNKPVPDLGACDCTGLAWCACGPSLGL